MAQHKNQDTRDDGCAPPQTADHTATMQTMRVRARQGNHDDYLLPASLSHLSALPLYLVVAHFALQAGAPVSREKLCRTFRINTRRALAVMRYLLDSKTPVMCTRMPPDPDHPDEGVRIRVWEITGRYETRLMVGGELYFALTDEQQAAPEAHKETAAPLKHAGKSRMHEEKERDNQMLRRWFLKRPNHE